MSTLEDKILDGPRVNYCDADDDDIRFEEDDGSPTLERHNASELFRKPEDDEQSFARLSRATGRTSGSSNTGPKGVIEDFRVNSLDSEKNNTNIDLEFQELLEDDNIIKDYIAKRILDAEASAVKVFGQIYHLTTGEELLDAIDKEPSNILVIVHIYTKYSKPCSELNKCLGKIASKWKHVKFCSLDASVTSLSDNFKRNGVPAILGYKGGEVVKSLVQLEDFLDKNFDVDQVQELLNDNGLR